MRGVWVVLFVVWLAGCTGLVSERTERKMVYRSAKTVDLSDSALVESKLLTQHSEWKGTRYRLGGLSKEGIDCSGFVFVTFKTKLGLILSRSTALQVKEGRTVSKDQLQTGDLVFFKTGLFTRHVGIYLGDFMFLHASTSAGVTISSLKNSYWASNYWISKRY